jgi:hypothetical protein
MGRRYCGRPPVAILKEGASPSAHISEKPPTMLKVIAVIALLTSPLRVEGQEPPSNAVSGSDVTAESVDDAKRQRAEAIVQELAEWLPYLPGYSSDPRDNQHPSAKDKRRERLFDELWSLGPVGLEALGRGLYDPDLRVRHEGRDLRESLNP